MDLGQTCSCETQFDHLLEAPDLRTSSVGNGRKGGPGGGALGRINKSSSASAFIVRKRNLQRAAREEEP